MNAAPMQDIPLGNATKASKPQVQQPTPTQESTKLESNNTPPPDTEQPTTVLAPPPSLEQLQQLEKASMCRCSIM